MKFTKIVLAILVCVCLYVSANRLIDLASGSVPPGKVGECLAFHDNGSKQVLIGKVIANNKKAKKSILEFDMGTASVQIVLTFGEQREMNAKRVNCE